MTGHEHDQAADPCTGCTGRRDFLREAAGIAAALLVGLGARPTQARALTVAPASPRAVRDGEASYTLPAVDGALIDRPRELILVRWQGKAYAFSLSCPHQHTMLRWQEADARFQCPKHHSRYQPDGSFVSGRATRGMDRYPLRLDGGEAVVDLTRRIRQDEDAAGWRAAFATV
jgi:nitrite reductase/ring-hydroxylating ferredoxin subunit